MKLELDIVWHKIMTLTIVILLSINDGVSQSAVEQREQFFLEALQHPENIKEQINGYAQYKNDKDKQELYRIYLLTKGLINFEDSLESKIDEKYKHLMDSVKKQHENNQFLELVTNQVRQLESIDKQNQLHAFKTSLNPKFRNGMTIHFDPAVSFYLHAFLPSLRFRKSSRLENDKLNKIDQTIGQLISVSPNIQELSTSFYFSGHQNRSNFINSLNANLNEVYDYFVRSVLYLNQESKRNFAQPVYALKKGTAFVKILRPISDFIEKHVPDLEYQYYAIIYNSTPPFTRLIYLGNGPKLEKEFYQEYFDNYANPYSSGRLDEDFSYKRYWEAIEQKLPKNVNQLFFQAHGIYNKVMIEALVNPNGNFIGDSIDIIRNFEINSDQIRPLRKSSKRSNKTFDLFGFPDYERLTLDSLPTKPKSFAEMVLSQLDSDKSQKEKDQEMQAWGQQNLERAFNNKIEERRTQDSSLNINQEKALYDWVQKSSEYKSIDPGLPSESDSTLSPLLMSKYEIKVLNKILLDNGFTGNYFLDTLATEKNIKKVESPTVLHISTHAENDKPSEVGSFAPDETKLFLSGAYYNLNKESVFKSIETEKSQVAEEYNSRYSALMEQHIYTKELQELMLNSRSIKSKKAIKDYFDSVNIILEGQKPPGESLIQKYQDRIYNFALQDGALDSKEIEELSLSGTQIVTLATCGPINQYIPEYHTTNIAELFLNAGVGHVVGSFWPVNDEATTAFMLKFYKHWLDGNSERMALKKAQKDIREIPQFNHPYFWGGWMVYSRFYFNH